MPTEPIPRRLSLIGYWRSPEAPPDRQHGWPDPADLIGAWDDAARQAVIDHLNVGTVFRVFGGVSHCRLCDENLGDAERTDGTWAWPQGLAHYVEVHGVRLPAEFVAHAVHRPALPGWLASLAVQHWVQGGDEGGQPVIGSQAPEWVVDEQAWLDWSADHTPARPGADAISIDEARQICARLSHTAWTAALDDHAGRWRIRLGPGPDGARIYLDPCAAGVLERRLLTMRVPDPQRILQPQDVNRLAAEYDGPWGAARVLAGRPQAWLVWVKPPSAEWPSQEEVQRVCAQPMAFGWRCAHPGGGESFIVPPLDEVGVRWMLTVQREQAASG